MFQDGGVFLETFKGASQVSKRSSKGVSRQFQRHFKEVLGVSSVFKEDFKKSFKGFQESFNKFFFSILLLQGSHRSYPTTTITRTTIKMGFDTSKNNLVFFFFLVENPM